MTRKAEWERGRAGWVGGSPSLSLAVARREPEGGRERSEPETQRLREMGVWGGQRVREEGEGAREPGKEGARGTRREGRERE